MQQYISASTTPIGSPHYAHNDPWAHALICCDQDHGASSSNPMNTQLPPPQQHHGQTLYQTPPNHHPLAPPPQARRCIECSAECPLEAYCCGGDYCCDGSHSHGCNQSEESICGDPTCEETMKEPCHEEHPFHPQGQCGDTLSHHLDPDHIHTNNQQDNIGDMKSLEEWADTKEGCHAIQQLLECCNQPDCNIPVCPTDKKAVHPAPPDPLAAIFGSMVAQPIEPSNTNDSGPSSEMEGITHTCHWGNCHLIFKSMPDLLAHVAADHLSAWGSGTGAKSTDPAPPTAPPPQMTNVIGATSNFMSTSTSTPPMQLANTSNTGLNSAFTTPQATETDQLLSCLWDDCFPVADMPSSSVSGTFPQDATQIQTQQIPHTHVHQAHSHSHEHAHPTGEPFSPGTMLRHVLEEHLGVPGSIIGWPNDNNNGQNGNQTNLDKNHHHHHVDPHHLAHHHAAMHHHHSHSHNHSHSHSHPFPTPPSTVNTQLSTSPASIPSSTSKINSGIGTNASGNPLICLWPGCPVDHVFSDSASLMDHLSEVHIPKGKDSYVCHWDNCGDGQGRVFKSRQKVLRHLQSHTGHKPFVCGVCDQAFSEAAPLSAHMRRHAQQKPFKCEYPGCGKTFAVSSSLTIHMRTHNGEKPYICPHCGRGFVEASNLTKHIRTHTGERPFACAHPNCGKKFSRPDQLKRHMLVHDKDKTNGNQPGQGHARRRSSVQTSLSDDSGSSHVVNGQNAIMSRA
ncbi:hypothetical protein L486_02048 [Kwoniella mangroviensis CBS 10435]|uniref:C2H2-type domain-containing protein n=1 Tax=Kwoniella mangroviensis CBS 10435 TaxID=1331196 RepID=A0A1B9IV34_9TREE|nr:hypothetical protein L486_02048 [Kwoniella mangroviensis CBS 10435]